MKGQNTVTYGNALCIR